MDGWIKLYRQLIDCSVFKNPSLLKVWIWCLLKASHDGYTTMVGLQNVSIEKGQFVFGRKKAADELDMTESSIYRFIKKLENEKMLNIKTNNKYSIISIEKYNEYQYEENKNEQQKNNKKTTNEQQMNTNKNKRTKEINNKLVAEPTTELVDAFISLILNDKTEHPVTLKQINEWKELYPAVNVEQELRNMKGWLIANPTKRKTEKGILRFINTWLSKQQDKGGNYINSNNRKLLD